MKYGLCTLAHVHIQLLCLVFTRLFPFLCPKKLFIIAIFLQQNKCNFMCPLCLFFTLSLFNLEKHVNYCEKTSFSLFYLTLVTSCTTAGPFLCCHLLQFIIYFKVLMQGKLIAVVYTLRTHWNPLWAEFVNKNRHA